MPTAHEKHKQINTNCKRAFAVKDEDIPSIDLGPWIISGRRSSQAGYDSE